MANGKFVGYYRVSTQKQGASGLGLEAQKAAVLHYLNGGTWDMVDEYIEVETGKGADALAQRPQLRAAIERAKKSKSTLVIAKLDRLARNVHFISGLIETGADFVCADMPHASKTMLQIYSVMAEFERDQISARTKAALAAAKARGARLGSPQNLVANVAERQAAADAFARRLQGTIEGMNLRGLTQRAMIAELNTLGIKTVNGAQWSAMPLNRVLRRLEAMA